MCSSVMLVHFYLVPKSNSKLNLLEEVEYLKNREFEDGAQPSAWELVNCASSTDASLWEGSEPSFNQW